MYCLVIIKYQNISNQGLEKWLYALILSKSSIFLPTNSKLMRCWIPLGQYKWHPSNNSNSSHVKIVQSNKLAYS
jgi:hypothetical protein